MSMYKKNMDPESQLRYLAEHTLRIEDCFQTLSLIHI